MSAECLVVNLFQLQELGLNCLESKHATKDELELWNKNRARLSTQAKMKGGGSLVCRPVTSSLDLNEHRLLLALLLSHLCSHLLCLNDNYFGLILRGLLVPEQQNLPTR